MLRTILKHMRCLCLCATYLACFRISIDDVVDDDDADIWHRHNYLNSSTRMNDEKYLLYISRRFYMVLRHIFVI